ncbi:MAG: hypothetical protein ACRDYX_21530 [Egibacteraceae bacterium]
MTLPRAVFLYPNDGCLTVARALVRRGIKVHALTDSKYGYVLASRRVKGRVMPHVRQDPDAWLEELGALADAGGGLVICGSDAACEWVARNRAALPESLRTFESTDGVHLALMDKRRLYRTAAEAGVRVPWMHHVTTRAELDDLQGELPYPCILKPTLAHVAKRLVGFGTLLIESRTQLVERAGQLLDHDVDLLLTELVPGPETALEGAVAVRDQDGTYTLEYGRHKVRQWPLDYGVGSLLEAAHVPEMLKMNRRLLDYVGFHGISACEAKRHAGNGELYLIEINVRVPASFGLAEACGVDGSWRLYATLAGIPLEPQPPQIDGRKAAMHPDLRAAWERVRRGDASLPEVLGSWRGTRDFGVFDVHDPMPTISLAGQLLRKQATTLLRRQRLPHPQGCASQRPERSGLTAPVAADQPTEQGN